MRLPLRRWAAVGLGGLTAAVVLLGPAAGPAAAAPPTRPAVGGGELGSTGTVQPPGTPPLPAAAVAPSFVVADLGSGAVYAARNPHQRTLPASTLKTLTALVLIPRLDPNQVVTADTADVTVDGTRVGIVPGGRYTIRSLFQALLMMSGNDAAELLARAGGSREQTLAEMNATAAQLQAYDTHAVTPSGLDGPGQSISAYDLALINRQAMALPAFREYVATRRVTFGAIGGKQFELDTQNALLRDGYPGALGGKDGYTDAARHTFVGVAARGGRTLIVTLTGTDVTYGRQAEQLLDWGFALPAGTPTVGRLVDPLPAAATPGGPGVGPAAGAVPAAAGRLQLAGAGGGLAGDLTAQVALSVAGVLLFLTLLALQPRPRSRTAVPGRRPPRRR